MFTTHFPGNGSHIPPFLIYLWWWLGMVTIIVLPTLHCVSCDWGAFQFAPIPVPWTKTTINGFGLNPHDFCVATFSPHKNMICCWNTQYCQYMIYVSCDITFFGVKSWETMFCRLNPCFFVHVHAPFSQFHAEFLDDINLVKTHISSHFHSLMSSVQKLVSYLYSGCLIVNSPMDCDNPHFFLVRKQAPNESSTGLWTLTQNHILIGCISFFLPWNISSYSIMSVDFKSSSLDPWKKPRSAVTRCPVSFLRRSSRDAGTDSMRPSIPV